LAGNCPFVPIQLHHVFLNEQSTLHLTKHFNAIASPTTYDVTEHSMVDLVPFAGAEVDSAFTQKSQSILKRGSALHFWLS
jgi:hypothetical protein